MEELSPFLNNITQEDYLKTCDPHNFAVRHPELLIQDATGKLILNPARDEVKEFIIYSMVELAMNYDVDGVHFDDYFILMVDFTTNTMIPQNTTKEST